MLVWILVFIVVIILCLAKSPSDTAHDSGEMTDARRRELIKKGQKAFREERNPSGGLRWMGNRKRQNRNKSFWD